jgi:hypothetical protein
MSRINYDDRRFASVSNTASGEVSSETVFHYHQTNDLVWAEYRGGEIRFGSLIAKVLDDARLEMRYQHLNAKGELMTGRCVSTPEILADGRIRLFEKWHWTCNDFSSGESVVEEIKQ